MPTILITGVGGFVGSHLAEALSSDPTNNLVGMAHPAYEGTYLPQEMRVYHQDILNADALGSLVAEINPDAIFHLAGMAHVHESWIKRRETIETNFLGTFHLLEACRALPRFPKVLLIGSGECYGSVSEEEQPIVESRSLVPSSPYTVSKIAQEMLGVQYARAESFPVYLSRSFNHTGPRQRETFVCSAFAKQIASAEAGFSAPELHVGNLVARRDFTDVRDVVSAYQSILDRGIPGDPYNVASGFAMTIEEILQTLLSHSSLKFRVVVDPQKYRPVDVPILSGSPEKLKAQTGWKPRYALEATLRDLLDYWRAELAR
jgi:GDP-4-dehydro-6-deoxy-D-mannose reductase